ncbi:Hypothetical protein, putative, partial [Bodo saltans]
MHRQRVTMGEKSQWKWLQKMHDALRTTHTNAILAILDEHHAAVVSFNELSFAAHAAVLKNGEEQLIAQEERQREVMEKREDDHRDVARSAQRSLRWNVVTLQQHHAAVAASLDLRMHRQRVTMGEKSQWKWLLKMHDALRTTHTNAILAILDEHHAAVVSFNELSFAAHAAVLKNGEEQLIAQEERQREVMEKREDDHRDVARSAQRSLRWNVVTLQQHHAAVAASLEGERGNASNRHQFGDDEGSERELVEAKEKKVRMELVSIFNDLTRQHFSNERSHKVAHEELYDQCSSSLLQFLKSLHQDHPADLADKAPYMLTNDGTCTMLDFSSFHRNGNRCSDDTIDTIASLMRHTKHVEHIIIRNNVMSEFGGRLTKRGIITLTTLFHQLTRVDLRNCKIGDEEAKILFRAVENHPDPVLEVLALDDNLITSDGCRQLLTTLRAPNSPLVDVTVTGNEGIPKGMMSVVAFYCQL